MARHLAVQQEALVEVSVDRSRRPGGSPTRGYVTALAAGLITGALVGGLVCFFSSCNQHPVPSKAPARFNFTCPPKGVFGRYDIATTVNKMASYLIHGEVKDDRSEVILALTWKDKSRPFETKHKGEGYVLYLEELKLSSGYTISVDFRSPYQGNCSFSVYELWPQNDTVLTHRAKF